MNIAATEMGRAVRQTGYLRKYTSTCVIPITFFSFRIALINHLQIRFCNGFALIKFDFICVTGCIAYILCNKVCVQDLNHHATLGVDFC